MPRTETWRLLTVVSATLTCGLLRYLPCFNASAICAAAALVVSPATLMVPTSGIRIEPFSSTRVSSVRSGCWNTVTCTASPTPSFSTGCTAFSARCGTAFSARCGTAFSACCGAAFSACCGTAFTPCCAQPASIHSNSPNRTYLISPRSGFVSRSPFDVCYVLDARAVAQLAHFRGGKLHTLARRQELFDQRRSLLLGKRRRLRLEQLHHRNTRRRGEYRDVAFLHARELRQLRERHLLRRLRQAHGGEARVARLQPGRDPVEVGGARRLRAQHLDELGGRRHRQLAQPVDAPLGEQRRVLGVEGAHLFGRAARQRRRGAVEVGLRQQAPARVVDLLRHLGIVVEARGERFLHQQLAVDDPFERLGS